jgi:outer membrane biosynthesis protein TonB
VSVGKDAAVSAIRLARSSGYALLDAKAEEIIGRAARATAIPESLRGREFVVDLPVEFDLENRIEGE